jgi:hypothetical protein
LGKIKDFAQSEEEQRAEESSLLHRKEEILSFSEQVNINLLQMPPDVRSATEEQQCW